MLLVLSVFYKLKFSRRWGTINGAEIVIKCLEQEKISRIFGYAGATICHLAAALKESDKIEYTLVRNEQNAGHMASGYGRVSGSVGVCMVTSGPGATNLITGIATAHLDSIPLVAITGQAPSNLLGRDIFQEVDITGAIAPFSKHSYLVKDVNEIPRIIKEAFYIASTGRPGAVLIDIPSDIQAQKFSGKFSYPDEVNIRGYRPSDKGNDLQIRKVVEAISRSKRPVICAGGGIVLSKAGEELEKFATEANIPVVTTMMGLSLLETYHPLNFGMVGAHGNGTANIALAKSDLVIFIGARVSDRAIVSPETVPERTATIHIDIDPAEIGKNMRTHVPVVGEIKTILNQLIPLEPKADSEQWISEMQEIRKKRLVRELKSQEGYVFPPSFLRLLGSKLSENPIISVDVGQNQLMTCRHLSIKQGARILTTGGLGTMGYAIPAGIGAHIADRTRQNLVICGDGSFQMSMNELSAMCAEKTNIKVVIFENTTLGLVRQIQDKSFGGAFGVSLVGSPNFQTIANAYGIENAYISDEDEMETAIDKMLGSSGNYILIVRVHPEVCTTD